MKLKGMDMVAWSAIWKYLRLHGRGENVQHGRNECIWITALVMVALSATTWIRTFVVGLHILST